MQSQIDMVEQMKTRHDMPLFRGQSSRKIIPIMFLDIVEKRACTKKSQNQTGLVITLAHSFVLVLLLLSCRLGLPSALEAADVLSLKFGV